jgi:hypothetical protein
MSRRKRRQKARRWARYLNHCDDVGAYASTGGMVRAMLDTMPDAVHIEPAWLAIRRQRGKRGLIAW